MELNFKQTLFSLDKKNCTCNDCGDSNVKYVSINNGITLCELCAEIHKNFGYQISFIRSIEDQFDDYLVGFFIYGGNKKFKKKMRNLGVNLDQKKGNLYRTFGADFYRRNLKSIVKGNSYLDIDFQNANEVMKEDSNSFPEFENYIVNSKFDPVQMIEGNNNNINSINNELNGLNINIDLGFHNTNEINNEFNFAQNINEDFNNANNNNNINDIQINNEEKKIEAIENKPEAPPSEQASNETTKKTEDKKIDITKEGDDEGSAERRVKNAIRLSVKGIKKLGKFMKKSGIKGYDLAKKYSKATAKVATEYYKNNFQKKK